MEERLETEMGFVMSGLLEGFLYGSSNPEFPASQKEIEIKFKRCVYNDPLLQFSTSWKRNVSEMSTLYR